MRLRASVIAVVLGLTAALGLAPGAAEAARHRSGAYDLPSASFAVSATNGYQVEFLVSEYLLLAAARNGPYHVSYVVPDTEITHDRFTGRLPGIGGVSVKFHQRGKTMRQGAACSNRPPTLTRKGVFTGTIRLRGEGGYTEVRAAHARGSVTQEPRRPCLDRRSVLRTRSHPTASSREPSSVQFTAETPQVQIEAAQIGDEAEPGLSAVSAAHLRRHDGMLVSSSARKALRHPAILFTNQTAFPETATVAPGQPFSGSARFGLTGPKSSTWTGDLAVTLPGVGPVRLAGPSFRSTLCLGADCRGSLPSQITSGDSEGYVGYGPAIPGSR